MAFTKGKTLVAMGTTSGDLLLLDTLKGEIRKLAADEPGLGMLRLDPTETMAVTGKGMSFAVWNLLTGERLFAFSNARQGVWDVTFSANNHLLASIGLDGILRLWGIS